ncbi:hypothetical protein CLAFUW4_08954 [Fulvia fulva]|uniref:Uncharacterized protein n=1 Tax=Passalora fulva TaxID=5499 RepID=A0A9Q8UTA3_PASFU|nr:uncharacterized protein CLAFUR5_09062 [Fulvia fulva]KAK4614228.1 hypothetical protein CLAFUR4_08960 [Fulvia fulva]KAK4614391.1 hypothetical protein CLAFUR0_08952 [Fulvia fulva]UJO21714.1 hypothetical protein CLAFUR5_09062 [Fulvia fulva]WPV19837.1 hypothetical protein CLAFUW4_08954 [Fulvia fulva]WPV35280.1 hypothetical protein CLAFUW7_08955 [Fulvia fulva]
MSQLLSIPKPPSSNQHGYGLVDASEWRHFQNRFEFLVAKGDCTVLQNFCFQAGGYWSTDATKKSAEFLFEFGTLGSSLSWSASRKWLHAYYLQLVPGFTCTCRESGISPRGCCALSMAFVIIAKLWNLIPWDEIETIVELHKQVTEQQANGRWTWDD